MNITNQIVSHAAKNKIKVYLLKEVILIQN